MSKEQTFNEAMIIAKHQMESYNKHFIVEDDGDVNTVTKANALLMQERDLARYKGMAYKAWGSSIKFEMWVLISPQKHSQKMYEILKEIVDPNAHYSGHVEDDCYPYYICNFCGDEWKFNSKETHEPDCVFYRAQQLIKAIDDWNKS